MGKIIAIDTESDEGRPYSIQVSIASGTAIMILLSETRLVRRLVEHINHLVVLGWTIIFHHSFADLDIAEIIGLDCRRFRDTLQECYHLGNLPQGLKAAVYRIFGYRMTSYDEVVTPYSKAALETWLSEALAHVSTSMRTEVREQLKTKVRVTSKPHEAEAVLRRVMSHLDSDYDPWEQPKVQKGEEKPRLIGRDWLPEVERAVGRMPRRSIIHAPIEQQVEYACGDADWTGRLAAWLDGERKRIVREEWKVA